MKKIAIIYTSMGGLVQTMNKLLKKEIPDYEIVNIADDSLIREVIQNGGVTSGVHKRLMSYFQAAADMQPEVIISACSSVGAVAEYADEVLDVPIIRIDQAMIEAALDQGSRIGILASLETTMIPTREFVMKLAKKRGCSVVVHERTAQGAYEANGRGEVELHDELIRKAALEIAGDCDALILAQGSMARMEVPLEEAVGIPVFSSPVLCVQNIAARLEEKTE